MLWKNSRYLSVEETITAIDPNTLETKTTLGMRKIEAVTSSNIVHYVSVNENLFDISLTYYNDARLWWKIADANRDVITDPYELTVGQKLLIPD